MRYIHHELRENSWANAIASIEDLASKNLLAAREDKKNSVEVLKEVCNNINK